MRPARGATAPFVSDAEAMPIYVWPSGGVGTGVVAVAAAALAAGVSVDRARVAREQTNVDGRSRHPDRCEGGESNHA